MRGSEPLVRFKVEGGRLTLSESEHNAHADGTHDAVAEEKTEGSTVGEGASRSEEQTGTDDTSDRDHRDVTREGGGRSKDLVSSRVLKERTRREEKREERK
jgi:hypothetical protein